MVEERTFDFSMKTTSDNNIAFRKPREYITRCKTFRIIELAIPKH